MNQHKKRLARRSTLAKTRLPRRDRSRHVSGARSGFTLLELLLVLSILVVVGGIAVVNLGAASEDANVNATKAQLNSLKQSIQMYQIRMNELPESLDNLRDGPNDSAKKASWGKPILEEIPGDAWSKEIVYKLSGNEYEIRSGGIDGQVNTEDDLIVTGS